MALLIALMLLLPTALLVSLIIATLTAVSRHEARMRKLDLAVTRSAGEPASVEAQAALQECIVA